MNNKIIYKFNILLLTGAAIICFAGPLNAQTKESVVSATIVDEQGNPVEGVKVYTSQGNIAMTDSNGVFEIITDDKSSLIIEKENYESKKFYTSAILGEITLQKSILLASEKDIIKMGISTKYQREMTGAVSKISPKEHLTYDHTQYVRDYIDGMLIGVQGSSNIRGLGGALFVIDGVIGRTPDILNMEEVDQITVLKDANAVALYGNQARNGVIIINTKRGEINKKVANVNVRYGIRKPISLPKYLNSVQYMELYNEARENDGLDIYYDPEVINAYRSNSNPYRYPDIDYYSDEFLRSSTQRTDVVTEFSNGNGRSKYYVNMGWNYSQSLIKLNPDANAGTNQFNVRGNIDFKINDFIKSSIDAVAIINRNKSSLTDWYSSGSNVKPNAYAPLLPISMMYDTTADGTLTGQIAAANKYDGKILGTSQEYQDDTPYARAIAGGYNKSIFRSTQFNNAIDFDLDMITKGLSARTYLSFDFYDAYNVSVNNIFQSYAPVWKGDSIVGLTPYGDPDRKDQTENVSTNGYVSRLGFYGLINYKRTFNNIHTINTTLLGYGNSHKQTNVLQTDKNAHIGFQLAYDFKEKLFLDFSAAYINSIKLPVGNRGGFSPTFGVAYILSEEGFIKSIDFINFLKVKASAGIIKSDIGINGYYLYSENYTDGGYYSWADGVLSNRGQNISQGASDDMTFEERIDLNIGFESYLVNSVWLEFNFFKTDMDKRLTKLYSEYPSFYNSFTPYSNYNKDTYTGFELGLEYKKSFNDFSVVTGGNILYSKSEAVKRSEVYNYEYLNNAGKPTNAIFGLVDDGFYSESDFIVDANNNLILKDGLPIPAFGRVRPGDIKYVDQNGDDVIDLDDQKYIGQWYNPLSYGINMKFSYKGFSLFVLCIGHSGGEAYRWNDYYWVDGNDKYSEEALNRWTPETAESATFPRLSSLTNDHNFQPSTFWIYNNSYFDIKRAQLTYEINSTLCQKLKMKALSVNISGVNLVRIAENKEYQQLNITGGPQYRYFSLGLRTSF